MNCVHLDQEGPLESSRQSGGELSGTIKFCEIF
jgi:hypothetical protein